MGKKKVGADKAVEATELFYEKNYLHPKRVQKLFGDYAKRIKKDYISEEEKGLVETYLMTFVADLVNPRPVRKKAGLFPKK